MTTRGSYDVFSAYVVAAAITLGGCGFGDSGSALVSNSCKRHEDCPASFCDFRANICVTTANDTLLVALEVVPSSTTQDRNNATLTYSYAPEEFRESMTRNLSLDDAFNVYGVVRADDGSQIPADVIFSSQNPIPGQRALRFTTSSTTERMGPDGGGEDYAVQVIANRTYDVTVQPTGDAASQLPPWRLQLQATRADENGARLDLTYPTNLRVIRGRLVDRMKVVKSGFTVQAIEPVEGRIVSSTARSASGASNPGTFALWVSPNETEFVLRVAPPPGTAPYPTFDVDPNDLIADEAGVVTILVPDAPPVITWRGQVRMPQDKESVPVSSASVVFSTNRVVDEATHRIGTFRLSASTDSQGAFKVTLPKATYDVVITPPSGVESGVLVLAAKDTAFDENGNAQGTYMLPPRILYRGIVRTQFGEAMAGAAVQALAVGANDRSNPAAKYNRSGDTVTDVDGGFQLWLDYGTYDVIVKTPTTSAFPWVVRANVLVTPASVAEPITYDIAAPVPLTGVLRSADGTPVPRAELTAYGVVTTDAGSARTVTLGRAVTCSPDDEAATTKDKCAASGAFQLLLPPAL